MGVSQSTPAGLRAIDQALSIRHSLGDLPAVVHLSSYRLHKQKYEVETGRGVVGEQP